MDKILSLSSIRKRKVALADERSELEFRLSKIHDEEYELDEAENFVKRFGQQEDGTDVPAENQQERLPLPPVIRAKTTRDALLLALKVMQVPWQTANDVRVRAIQLKGANIPMATVSPTLSNLKNAGLIVRNGQKVALVSRLNEGERRLGGEQVNAQD